MFVRSQDTLLTRDDLQVEAYQYRAKLGSFLDTLNKVACTLDVDLAVDDYVFLRPTQSEFVMLQFGDLLPVKDGEIVGRWPVFHQTG